MKKESVGLLGLIIFVAGCNTYDYSAYVDAQTKISRDSIIRDSSHLSALLELAKSPDPAIRAMAIMQLERLHERGRIVIQPPK
jgi:hypothetical protein